jgi:hypothetical protein
MLDQPEYLTTKELAKLTRATEATVRYWRHMQTGPTGFSCGRRVLYARTVVEQWLRDLQTAPDAVKRSA